MLTFDAETHVYEFAGERVPSVTQILADVGLIDSRWFNDEACLRGRYVAQAIAYDMRGQLDDEALDEQLRPFVDAARDFRAKMALTPKLIEHAVYSPTWGYAGTLDVYGDSAVIGADALLDWKCGAAAPWHPLQTKAYEIALGPVSVRGSVLLRENGTFRFIEHRDSQADEALWLACVQVFKAKARMA